MNDTLTLTTILTGIAHSGLRLATPYLYAALGEMFAQRSGVLNLGVEGIMLMGAFSGFYVLTQTGNPWLGLLAAIVIGGVLGLVMAFISVTLQAEQGISGIGLYMVGLGLSSLLFKTMLGTIEGATGFQELRFCVTESLCLSQIPVIGEVLFRHNFLVYGAFALVPLAGWVINKTTWGLSIRAVGQSPQAADSLGVSVVRVRYATVIVGGVLAGIAGASLSIGLLNIFQEGMTNGQGFIAVALVYFGSWTPVGVMVGALFFSLLNALQLWVQVLGLNLPADIAVMIPYVLTIVALALPFRRALAPAALGKAFNRGQN